MLLLLMLLRTVFAGIPVLGIVFLIFQDPIVLRTTASLADVTNRTVYTVTMGRFCAFFAAGSAHLPVITAVGFIGFVPVMRIIALVLTNVTENTVILIAVCGLFAVCSAHGTLVPMEAVIIAAFPLMLGNSGVATVIADGVTAVAVAVRCRFGHRVAASVFTSFKVTGCCEFIDSKRMARFCQYLVNNLFAAPATVTDNVAVLSASSML